MINTKDFDSSLPKINKKSYKNIGIYNIGYITFLKIDDSKYIHSINPLHMMIGEVHGHIEAKNESKYLVFDVFSDENEKVIHNEIFTINRGKADKFGKDFIKVKFDSDDDLPLNKQLTFSAMAIVVRSDFEKGGKFYPQIYLDECL